MDILRGPYPFAGDGRPFVDNQAYKGGWLRIIPPMAANANFAIRHGLRSAIPRFATVLDIGTNNPFPTPLPRGATAWGNGQIFLNWPATTQPVVLWIAA